ICLGCQVEPSGPLLSFHHGLLSAANAPAGERDMVASLARRDQGSRLQGAGEVVAFLLGLLLVVAVAPLEVAGPVVALARTGRHALQVPLGSVSPTFLSPCG